MPRRSSVFGLPPSTIHSSHFWPGENSHAIGPSAFGTSRWIHACGFTHSIFVTLPLSRTGLFGSNSPPNAWCAMSGADAAAANPIPASNVMTFVRIAFTSLVLFGLRRFRLAQPGAAKDVAQRVVPFMARVFVEMILRDRPRVFTRPRPIPRVGILDRELILQRVRSGAR